MGALEFECDLGATGSGTALLPVQGWCRCALFHIWSLRQMQPAGLNEWARRWFLDELSSTYFIDHGVWAGSVNAGHKRAWRRKSLAIYSIQYAWPSAPRPLCCQLRIVLWLPRLHIRLSFYKHRNCFNLPFYMDHTRLLTNNRLPEVVLSLCLHRLLGRFLESR